MKQTEALILLRKALNNLSVDFRSGQWEAIDSVVNKNKKLLLVQRTGWGKSIVYFLSTRILRDKGKGITIIISPLLALMRNQIEAAERIGIRAATINSANTDDWENIKDKVLSDEVDVLLISPERLANDNFIETVLLPLSDDIGLFVVDEAHCISDWGHDFRPDYRRIVNILKRVPENLPILATTATANNRVVKDVKQQLSNFEICRGSLVRKSLYLQTLRLPDQAQRLAWLAEHIQNIPGTGIIYTLTKRDAEIVSGWLKHNDINAEPYYSDVKNNDYPDSNLCRLAMEEKLLKNEIKALVATSALGMGYDKPDLGFVIHYQAPGSVVSYYQQVGRAGRAIDKAYGILLTGKEDDDIHEYFRRKAFPDEKEVLEILNLLENHEGLSVITIQEYINLSYGNIEKVLKLLSVENPAPIIKQGSKYYRTPVKFKMDRDRIEFLTHQKEKEWLQMQEYIDHNECLMNFLQIALDDPTEQKCNNCENCKPAISISADSKKELAYEAYRFIRQNEIPLILKIQVAPDSFPVYGFKGNLHISFRGETGRILSRWRDAGWGHVVADGKHNNHFDDELVDAVAEMIEERWNPSPMPLYITCVPSLNHIDLVPDFSKRIADKLGLEFLNIVKKVKNNSQQKFMQNRFNQCSNLDGAFTIEGNLDGSPVFLIDDIVDACWTLTIITALLKQAGAGPVFPIALASTATGQ
ncbi:MAG: ATP-dependent DNA helicase RecG [Ignavibacteriae bacterium]|nr:MAG: ATP-dependent DNA helicase RecG [Ignavibacteriota bacterium]